MDLGAFAPLQVEIPGTPGESYLIDSKVVAVLEKESSFIIRFTGIDADAAGTLQHWLTRN